MSAVYPSYAAICQALEELWTGTSNPHVDRVIARAREIEKGKIVELKSQLGRNQESWDELYDIASHIPTDELRNRFVDLLYAQEHAVFASFDTGWYFNASWNQMRRAYITIDPIVPLSYVTEMYEAFREWQYAVTSGATKDGLHPIAKDAWEKVKDVLDSTEQKLKLLPMNTPHPKEQPK